MIFDHFFDFECFNLLVVANYDSTNSLVRFVTCHVTVLTNGEPTAEKIDAERVGVSTQKLSYFPTLYVLKTLQLFKDQYSKTPNTAGFLIKIFLNDPIKKNCFFDHSVNFLVNFLSQDFAQNFRNDNLEG